MTPIELRMRFNTETGNQAISHVNTKNRHTYLSDKYVEWLEGKNTSMRDQFRKETGDNAVRFDYEKEHPIYIDTYKTWLEERRLELYTVIDTFKAR